ncbi:MAG TPA: ABC transporter permease [Cyclobacteriaceae bacterium]
MKHNPPRWALNFLRWYCKEDYLDEIEGDLFEFYYIRCKQSKKNADLFFIWNVFRSFRLINIKQAQLNNVTMNLLSNYARIYFRRFRKETAHYLVNIIGLGMGFAILFLILMYVYDEHQADAYHSKKDRIYRVIEKSLEEDGLHEYETTPYPLAEALKNDFPGIKETAHMTYFGSHVLVKGETRIADRDWAVVTKDIFNILDFDIIAGDPKKDFQGPAGLILTEDAAARLFGHTDVVGSVVDGSRFEKIEVLAVMREMPRNSSYQFDAIYVANYDQWEGGWYNFFTSGNWDPRFAQTWVLLENGATPQDIYRKKDQFINKYYPEEIQKRHDFTLQPLTDIHLGSKNIERGGPSPLLNIPKSTEQFVSIIFIMGFFVLFIAALNYINLSSVQVLKRTLEASMRKINGASLQQLIVQLFFETLITVFIAYGIALLIIVMVFPYYQSITNKDFTIGLLFSREFIGYHILSISIIWIASALIPAFYYARLKRSLLNVKNVFSGKGDTLRKTLVTLQYALSLFLIIGSIIIYRQLEFVKSKDLGFKNDNLIVLDINSRSARSNSQNIINGIKTHPDVINASTSSRVPGEWKNIPSANLYVDLNKQPLQASHYGVDQFWLDTYGIELVGGRNFSGLSKADSLSIIINRQTVKMLGLDAPIGKRIWVEDDDEQVPMKVIGVVEDFHFESLYEPVGPVFLTSWNNHIRSIDYFTIRYSHKPKETIEHIKKVNATFDPLTPPEINFLDQQWQRFYVAEESRQTIILIASIVSIIISAFGLFGLINYTAERKTKEIGIRKVMGASVSNIVTLILKDYMILLVISLLVSIPVSYWTFYRWLLDFAYRINISIDIFLIAFTTISLISVLTVTSRILSVIASNPVEAIKYE